MLLNPSFRLGSGTEDTPIPAPSPPSSYLRLPVGPIVSAWETAESPHGKRATKPSPAQLAGLRYEKKVAKYLTPRSGGDWVLRSHLWFIYCDNRRGRNYCSPDFVLDMGPDLSVCVETKIRWTVDAWWQLERLYLPVLLASGRWKTIVPLCITKSFDPSVRPPAEVNFVDDIFDAKPGRFNLLVLR